MVGETPNMVDVVTNSVKPRSAVWLLTESSEITEQTGPKLSGPENSPDVKAVR